MVINPIYLGVYMKKIKKGARLDASLLKNPVAKFAYQFNKAQVFKDKTKYQRTAKHKGKEPFPMMLSAVLEKVSALALNIHNAKPSSFPKGPIIMLFV